ncbi:MAG: outer membrane lipoprotein-sorting protein [Treponema sp.]|jgi:outer membrane lipoprotein-sorting protein|nr:outer membrane lipoprotein-sorting protein [Treponema sp.]
MKRFVLFVLSAALCAGSVFAQDASAQSAISIKQAAKDRIQLDTMSSRSRMVITAKNGAATERVIDQYSKDAANGFARAVIVFQSPATVRGTRFLMMDNAAGKSDQWIFLPALGKVRRIASSESGGSFMGTDFSYDDMSLMDRNVEEDTHTVLREETLNGAACYVIESVPKDSDFQYAKTLTWIDKAGYRTYKVELYNKRGAVEKLMEMSAYKDIQGRDTSTQTKVSTLAAGTSTTIYMDIIKYDDPIPEGVFTTAYLETGRAR